MRRRLEAAHFYLQNWLKCDLFWFSKSYQLYFFVACLSGTHVEHISVPRWENSDPYLYYFVLKSLTHCIINEFGIYYSTTISFLLLLLGDIFINVIEIYAGVGILVKKTSSADLVQKPFFNMRLDNEALWWIGFCYLVMQPKILLHLH